MDWGIQTVFAGKCARWRAQLLLVASFIFLGSVGLALPEPHYSENNTNRYLLENNPTDTIVLSDPYDSDGLRLVAKQFRGSVNQQLGLGSPNTAGCVSNNRKNM